MKKVVLSKKVVGLCVGALLLSGVGVVGFNHFDTQNKISHATALVSEVEKSLDVDAFNRVKVLVAQLSDGAVKTELQAKLDVVDTNIKRVALETEIKEMIASLPELPTDEQVVVLREKVNSLEGSALKAEFEAQVIVFQERLDAEARRINDENEAQLRLVALESDPSEANAESLIEQANKLPDGELKNSLLNKANEVKNVIASKKQEATANQSQASQLAGTATQASTQNTRQVAQSSSRQASNSNTSRQSNADNSTAYYQPYITAEPGSAEASRQLSEMSREHAKTTNSPEMIEHRKRILRNAGLYPANP